MTKRQQDVKDIIEVESECVCRKHKKYRGVSRPRAACPMCWYLYISSIFDEYMDASS
jgi:hypothetical protein